MKSFNFTILFLLSLHLFGCGQKPKGRLLVFRDSISSGAYTSASYPKLLAESLNLALENHSVSSTALADDVQIGAIRAVSFQPGDHILFSPGINDALVHRSDPAYLAAYERLLTESLDRFEGSGGEAFVGEPLHALVALGVSAENVAQLGRLNEDSDAYASVLRRLIAGKVYQHVHLVESREQFHLLPNLMHDGVHPNDSGHRELFDIFRKAMESRAR
jgi:lysophospholipase L1-like esterase